MKPLKSFILVAMLSIATNLTYSQSEANDSEPDSIDYSQYYNLQHYCNDFANLLSQEDAERLELSLSKHADTSSLEIKVLTLPLQDKRTAEEAANKLINATEYKGALLIVKPTVFTGVSLPNLSTSTDENLLTTDVCESVIKLYMQPCFARKDYVLLAY